MSEIIKQKRREHYYANREERLAYQKEYAKRKKKKYNKYQREYYQKNKDTLNPERYFYAQAKRDADKKETKPLPQYKLNEIERVLKKKLKEIRKAEELFYSTVKHFDPPRGGGGIEYSERQNSDTKNSPPRTYDKYYQKKLLTKYQHSLPEQKPFADFYRTPIGFALKW